MVTPLATNELNSLGSFFQRSLYKDSSYPRLPSVASPLDIWYQKQLYGKVNEQRESVYPSEGFLKQFNTDGEAIYALNFVVDAFEDMKKFWEEKSFLGKINIEESPLADLTPVSAWANTNEQYHNYIDQMYNVFAESFTKQKGRNNRILDFQSFIKVFVEYVESLTPEFPITKTGFITSKYCPGSVSGLMIQLSDASHAVDEVKFEEYLQDTNFAFFTRIARQFGFKVDENAPWRLVADLASPGMKPYMDKNEISLDNLFEKFYYRSYQLDIEILKVYILQFYNSYVGANPDIKILKTSRKRGCAITEVINRKTITMEEMERVHNDKFWLKMFIYLRAKETNKKMDQKQFDKTVNLVHDVNRTLGFDKALEFAARKFRGVPPTVEPEDKEFFENALPRNASQRRVNFSFF